MEINEKLSTFIFFNYINEDITLSTLFTLINRNNLNWFPPFKICICILSSIKMVRKFHCLTNKIKINDIEIIIEQNEWEMKFEIMILQS